MDAPPDAAKEEADTAALPADVGELAAGDGARGAGDPGTHRQAIRWDRFLPRRSLRVLLVEHDDSTRHIVAALLRKCSYHVVAVADGMKAWEVLKEKHYNFDLVLTEVVMPSLSGIGLLTKVMASDECKNIPVIMMSSQDSIGVVLKCMLKGAADFLVKPVRRNELRNLWQHVWRRHCMQSNYCASATDNHAASNHSNANARVESKTGENSDQGDELISGSKPDMEIEDIERNLETQAEAGSSSRKVKLKAEQTEVVAEVSRHKANMDDDNHAIVESGVPAVEINQPLQASLLAEQIQDNNDLSKVPEHRVDEQLARHEEAEDGDPSSFRRGTTPNDSAQGMIDCNVPRISKGCTSLLLRDNDTKEALCETSTSSHSKSKAENCSSLLEFSLKRTQLNGSVNISIGQKHTWNHSDASAFSRYAEKRMLHHSYEKPVSSAFCMGTGESIDKSPLQMGSHRSLNAESCSLSSKEPLSSHQEKAVETTAHLQEPSDSNKEDACIFSSDSAREDACVGQSCNGADSVYHHPQFGFIPLSSVPVGAIPYHNQCASYGSILQPMFYPESSLHPQNSAAVEKGTVQVTSDQHCHCENVINQQQHIQYYQHKETHQSNHRRKQADVEQRHLGEPPAFPTEHANGSASCIHDIYRSSGSNGCGETVDAVANVGNTLESGNESGVQNYNKKDLDRDRSRREAALIKFRLKRKDRCFEKKVRYHSRKKLAEQRPRVKGQFVRQRIPDQPPATDAED